MGLTSLHDFYGSLFSLSTFFVASLVFMKGTFNWPMGYSSGSLSNLEPGTSSLLVRTVKDGSEPLVIHTFSLQGLTSMAFVCLNHDGV